MIFAEVKATVLKPLLLIGFVAVVSVADGQSGDWQPDPGAIGLGSGSGHVESPLGQPYGDFGYCVSVSGDLLAVGAVGDDPGGIYAAGGVYLFERDAQGAWNPADTGNLGSIAGHILNPQPELADTFGFSVSVSGGLLAVGAHVDDPGDVTDAGSIYLYERDPQGVWNPANTGNLGSIPGHIANPGPEETDHFGQSLSVSSGVLAVGASRDDSGGVLDAGSIYLYEPDSRGVWVPVDTSNLGSSPGQISNPQPQPGDYFGFTVSVSGGMLVVAATRDDSGGVPDVGSIYLYERDPQGMWNPADTGNLGSIAGHIQNPQPQGYDDFGHSVSISDGLLAVAKFHDPAGVDGVGSVYLYERDPQGVWNPANTGNLGSIPGHIPNPQPQAADVFGNSVSVSGDLLAVGVWLDDPGGFDNSGSIFIYERDPQGVWELANTVNLGSIPGNIPNPQPQTEDKFGCSVSVSGGLLAVGAFGDDDGAINTGSVYLYRRSLLSIRGDCNNDSAINIADGIYLLTHLFQGGEDPSCDDACDGNDDGSLNIADTVYLLAYLFNGGANPPPPFPGCGVDPTADALECVSYGSCP